MARPPSITNLSIAQLQQIIQSRKTEISRLERQRSKIARKLGQIDSRIATLGGEVRGRNGGAGGRVRNEKSLPEMLHTVLSKSSKAMGVGDIADAVRSGGYKTNSGNFRGIVNQTLIKDKRFSSAGRGLYQLKK
jgi:hypothetical protein